MADEAYVVDYKKAQAVEQRRAVTFVRERVLESATAMEHTPVDITDPNTTSYISPFLLFSRPATFRVGAKPPSAAVVAEIACGVHFE